MVRQWLQAGFGCNLRARDANSQHVKVYGSYLVLVVTHSDLSARDPCNPAVTPTSLFWIALDRSGTASGLVPHLRCMCREGHIAAPAMVTTPDCAREKGNK